MRKSLTTICALLLAAGLSACGGGSGNGSDEDRLNAAAGMLDPDNGVVDTSADDAAVNVEDLDPGETNQAAPANAAGTNAAAPGNNAASGNRQ